MKFLFDLFPVILFFAAYKFAQGSPVTASEYISTLTGSTVVGAQAPILLATLVAILATFAQVAWLLIRRKKVDTMLWISLAVIAVFGGATLVSQNATFIKWKPTVLYWLFAAILAGGTVFGRNFIRKLMEQQISLPDQVWAQLNIAWVVFFTALGFVNLYVAYSFSESNWVNFKVYGVLGLTMVFVLGQSFLLAKYVEDKQ